MKIGTHVILLFTLLMSLSCKGQSDKIETIWQVYMDDLGSSEQLKSVSSMSYRSTTQSPVGTSVEHVYLRFPDKVHYELTRPNRKKETIIANGGQGILIMEGDTTPLTDELLCRFSSMGRIFPEFYYRELGYEFSQVYSKKWTDYVNIMVETDCGDLVYIFDKDSHDLMGVKPNNYEILVMVTEKKLIQDIQLATKSITIMGQDTTQTYHDQYRINVELDDSLFQMK